MAKYIIVGSPNTGKTTLFNNLTGSKEKTANYSGVTVKEKSCDIKYKGEKIEIVDLPGLYSLNNLTSDDERAAKNYLEKNKDENILFLCSSSTINKNLMLLVDLINDGYKNIKVVINKCDNSVSNANVAKAKEVIGLPILQVDARKNKDEILDFIVNSGVNFLNENLKLEELLKLFPTDTQSLKKIDKLLLSPLWGKLIFFGILCAIIFISYGPIGNNLTTSIENFINPYMNIIAEFLSSNNMPVLADFFSKVIVNGVFGVLVYLPQLALMLTFIYMLEDSGYLPRVASNFNVPLEKCGMNGKSVFSLIMGLGCTTSSFLCTRNIDDDSSDAKRNTIRFLPFIGCSAKIPIILMVASMITGGKGIGVLILIYLLSIVVGFSYLKATSKRCLGEYFVVELPRLKLPSIARSVKQAVIITLDLFKRVFVSVGLVASVIWLLGALNTNFEFLSGGESLLDFVASYISIIFYPLGIKSPKLVTALITGMVAKENILSTLGVLGELEINFIQGMTFLVFVMFYSPCVSALRCVWVEAGKKEALFMFIRSMCLAYITAFVFYTFSLINICLGLCVILITCAVVVIFAKNFNSCSVGCCKKCENSLKKS